MRLATGKRQPLLIMAYGSSTWFRVSPDRDALLYDYSDLQSDIVLIEDLF
jgi:hypothetical protein